MARADLLTSLELALGRPLGIDPDTPPLPVLEKDVSPMAALEATVGEALQRPPCLVMFSGGRDSSVVLAVALRAARVLGLDPPIAFTLRFPGVAESEETEWQERVVRHLGTPEWLRRSVDAELDLLGPYATRVLLRHGVVWPSNAFVLSVVADAARGGSVLTGSFGDEMFAPDPWTPAVRTARSRGPTRWSLDALQVALAHSPNAVRRLVAARRYVKEEHLPPWLSPGTRSAARSMLADELAEVHLRWDAGVMAAWRRRYTQVVQRVLDLLAADAGARLITPFGHPRFRVAFARLGGSRGFRSRTEAMRLLFEGLLPEDVLKRSSKALFGGVFWNQGSRAFVQEWSGAGLDPELVDIEVLRQEWSWNASGPERPDFRSAALLQAAWLAAEGHVTPLTPTPRQHAAPSRTEAEEPPTGVRRRSGRPGT